MLDTATRFCAAIPASRRASSKATSGSRCVPFPAVKYALRGTSISIGSSDDGDRHGGGHAGSEGGEFGAGARLFRFPLNEETRLPDVE
jgi:hypothetical protein